MHAHWKELGHFPCDLRTLQKSVKKCNVPQLHGPFDKNGNFDTSCFDQWKDSDGGRPPIEEDDVAVKKLTAMQKANGGRS